MQGKKQFTEEVAVQVKSLLRKKNHSPKAEKQKIRRKLRDKLKFYITDFSSDPSEFGVADFEMLIKNGIIKILNKEANTHKFKEHSDSTNVTKHHISTDDSSELLNIQHELIVNAVFKKAGSVDRYVPNEPGFYCIRLAVDSELPEKYQSVLNKREHRIIYIGKAEGQSLRERLLDQELRANGHGTFFRSIGTVLEYRPPKGSLQPKQKNFRFSDVTTLAIIDWINENFEISWMEYFETFDSEKDLIAKYKPLLNISLNPARLAILKNDRKECLRIAREEKS